MDSRKQILVVEDDDSFRNLLRLQLMDARAYLPEFSFDLEILMAANGDEAWKILTSRSVDLVLADINMPIVNGYDLCRMLRSHPKLHRLPFIFLTIQEDADYRRRGYLEGGDYYHPKSQMVDSELILRIAGFLGRPHHPLGDDGEVLRFDALELNSKTQTITIGDRVVTLSPKQLAIVRYLMTHPDEPVTPDVLRDHALGPDASEMTTDNIRVHIQQLRAKLEEDPRAPRLIQTVGKQGYIMRSEATRA